MIFTGYRTTILILVGHGVQWQCVEVLRGRLMYVSDITGVVPCYSHSYEKDEEYAIELCLTVPSSRKIRKFCMSKMSGIHN